jgi:secondary thiamine-phosphate synthase enzyme
MAAIFTAQAEVVAPAAQPFFLCTREIIRALRGTPLEKIRLGVCCIHRAGGSGHGAITVNENADPSVRVDFAALTPRLAEAAGCVPTGPAAAIVAASLYGTSISLPIVDGRLVFGTWQGIYLVDADAATVVGPAANRRTPLASGASDQTTHSLAVACVDLASCGGAAGRAVFTAPSRGCHVVDALVGSKLPAVPASRRALPSRRSSATRDSPAAGGIGSHTDSDAADGLICVTTKHTSASLSLADAESPCGRGPSFGERLEQTLSAAVPERWNREFFTHTMEGDDDMPGHVKSTLMGCSALLPTKGGALAIGDDIALHLNEHRNTGGWGGGHARSIVSVFAPAAAFDVGVIARTVEVPGPGAGSGRRAEDATGSVVDCGALIRRAMPEIANVEHGLCSVVAAGRASGVAVADAAPAAGPTLLKAFGALGKSAGGGDPALGLALCGKDLAVPVRDGRLLLGEGQGLWLLRAQGISSGLIVSLLGVKKGK